MIKDSKTTFPQEESGISTAYFHVGVRIAVIFCLLATAVIVGVSSYIVLSNLQDDAQREQYYAIASKIESSTVNAILDKRDALTTSLRLTLQYCPTESHWPHCGVPMDFYQSVLNPLHRVTQTRTLHYSVKVEPKEEEDFENFAYSFYADQGYPNLGLSSFGKGIYAMNYTTGNRYHDTTGTSNGERKMLLPILQASVPNLPIFMFNLYSESKRIKAIDYAFDCVENSLKSSINCTSITEIIYLVQDYPLQRPAGIALMPIVPHNSTKVVGSVTAVFNWDTLLNLAANDKVDGIVAVLSDGLTSHTFLYNNGQVELIAHEDLHDSKYDYQKVVFTAIPFGGPTQYTVELYPTDEWMSHYVNQVPLISCLIMVGLVVFTSLVFYLYDFLMNREAVHKDLVMKTKRQYVRYISHEIRTPLNVVHLGFQVLYTEMKKIQASSKYYDQSTLSASTKSDIVLDTEPQMDTSAQSNTNISLFTSLSDWVDLVRDIVESLNAAIAVLNDLIDYDKIDSGTMNLQEEVLPVWNFVESSARPFIVQARAKDIDMNIVLDESKIGDNAHKSLILLGDRVKLSQVLRNLVSNALKFTPSGGVVTLNATWDSEPSTIHSVDSVSTSLHQKKSKHCYQLLGGYWQNVKPEDLIPQRQYESCGRVIITIVDTGAGMSQDQVRNLFREGVQFNPNDLQAGQGSGLGLWITKGIVDSHGGKLWATSEGEGKGTTFTLILPLYDMPLQLDHPVDGERLQFSKEHHDLSVVEDGLLVSPGSEVGDAGTLMECNQDDVKELSSIDLLLESQNSNKFHSILVTDDSAVNRKMMCRSLQSVGFKCFQASDGQECVDIVKKALQHEHEPIDLVLMDYEMPRMNGPKACSVLRDMRCGIPVIGVTGNVLNEDKRLFMEHGAIHVLQKPFSMIDLDGILSQLHQR